MDTETSDDGNASFALHDLAKALQEVPNIPIRTHGAAPQERLENDSDTIHILVALVECNSAEVARGDYQFGRPHGRVTTAVLGIPASVTFEQQLIEHVRHELLAEFAYQRHRFPSRELPRLPFEQTLEIHELRVHWRPNYSPSTSWDQSITDRNIRGCLKMMQNATHAAHPPCMYAFVTPTGMKEEDVARNTPQQNRVHRMERDDDSENEEHNAKNKAPDRHNKATKTNTNIGPAQTG